MEKESLELGEWRGRDNLRGDVEGNSDQNVSHEKIFSKKMKDLCLNWQKHGLLGTAIFSLQS